jgi:60 kDa SS-A/Ro ribonucleoprotein
MNYAGTLAQTTQSRPLPGHNMVKNNAGGYGFEITPQQRLERFLLIGSEGGTYYVDEQELTEDNAKSIISYIRKDGFTVINTLTDFIANNRLPKMDTALFVLALCATHGDPKTKQVAYASISKFCKTATHLFIFVNQVNQLRGWSAGLRRGVANWYTSKDDNKLSYQLVKYRNREGFTHKDVLRLAHPKALTDSQNSLFKYAVGKYDLSWKDNLPQVDVPHKIIDLPKLIHAFETAISTSNTKELIGLIKEFNLTWEMIPTQFLNEPVVLTTLLEKMPTVAMIRNLNRFSKAGMTNGLTDTTKTILSKLTKEAIQGCGIHPLNLVNAMGTYATGRGDKGSSFWNVNQNIVDALNDAYEFAISNIKPTGKTILVALDVSGSMNTPVTKTSLTATQLGAVLSVTFAKFEPLVEIIGFDTQKQNIPNLNKRTSIADAAKAVVNGGGTDCSIPFQYGIQSKNKYDAIVILTDSESWAGGQHGITLLNEYRKKINKDVKVIEIAMTGTAHSQLTDNDPSVLRICGFDSSVIQVVQEFLK